MNRSRLNCAVSLDDLRHEMDRLFESFLGTTPKSLFRGRPFPAVDIWEVGDVLTVQAELPGVSMDHIEIYGVGCELTLRGYRPQLAGENMTIHQQEQPSGDFERKLTLPIEIDPERVEASLKDGLLTITIPKPASAGARRIAIKGDTVAPPAGPGPGGPV